MDRSSNPYTPNAGARPPALIGRDLELEAFQVLLRRLAAGRTEQSLVVTGLRGVGKTVLLGEFRKIAEEESWKVVEIEVAKGDEDQFRRVLAREVRKVLHNIAPRAKWTDKTRRVGALLKSFTMSIDPEGRLTVGLDGGPAAGYADSGVLDADLTDLLIGLGEAAKDKQTGVALLLDEIHFLDQAQMEALIAALHKTVQRALPVTMAAAGLPQIHELVGEAKTYAERLFKFPEIGSFDDSDAKRVLSEPAASLGVRFSEEALEHALVFTQGYPYFLQELGQAAWDISPGPEITLGDVENARVVVEEKLDSGFFKVRLDRATELQRSYLRAMAELGPEPQLASDVARQLDRTSQQCGGTRRQLIEKGLLYTTEHGYAAFTVPQFDQYLKRVMPELPAAPVRRRT